MTATNRGGASFWYEAPWVDRLVMIVEGGSYLVAAAFAANWLIKRFMGRDIPTDDIEQGGLWVLAGLAALSIAFVVRRLRRRK